MLSKKSLLAAPSPYGRPTSGPRAASQSQSLCAPFPPDRSILSRPRVHSIPGGESISGDVMHSPPTRLFPEMTHLHFTKLNLVFHCAAYLRPFTPLSVCGPMSRRLSRTTASTPSTCRGTASVVRAVKATIRHLLKNFADFLFAQGSFCTFKMFFGKIHYSGK